MTGKPFQNRSLVYSIVDINIFKSKYEFDSSIIFEVWDIEANMWQLNFDDSAMSAYYPIYAEDGKSFSRDYNHENQINVTQ